MENQGSSEIQPGLLSGCSTEFKVARNPTSEPFHLLLLWWSCVKYWDNSNKENKPPQMEHRTSPTETTRWDWSQTNVAALQSTNTNVNEQKQHLRITGVQFCDMAQITWLFSTCGLIATLVMNTTHQRRKKKHHSWHTDPVPRGWATKPICCVLILGLYSRGSRGLNDPPPREKTHVLLQVRKTAKTTIFT